MKRCKNSLIGGKVLKNDSDRYERTFAEFDKRIVRVIWEREPVLEHFLYNSGSISRILYSPKNEVINIVRNEDYPKQEITKRNQKGLAKFKP